MVRISAVPGERWICVILILCRHLNCAGSVEWFVVAAETVRLVGKAEGRDRLLAVIQRRWENNFKMDRSKTVHTRKAPGRRRLR
jgi:hypothetical protein